MLQEVPTITLLQHYRGGSHDAFREYINLMDAKQKTQLAA